MITTIVNVKKEQLNKRNIKNFDEWINKKNTVYIGRNMTRYIPKAVGSKWGNPFNVNKYGREKCLELYENHVRTTRLYNELDELQGKELGCWCKPESCHGDILIKLLQEKNNKKH